MIPIAGRRAAILSSAIRYLLRATFGTDIAAPLPASLAVDVGTLTITDTNSRMSVTSGQLVKSGTVATSWVDPRAVSSVAYARVSGRALICKMTQDTGNQWIVGWSTVNTGLTTTGLHEMYLNGTALRYRRGIAISYDISLMTISVGVQLEAAVILRATGALFGTISAGVFTLQWVDNGGTTSPLYVHAIDAGSNYKLDNIRILDLARLDARFATNYGLATSYQAAGSAAAFMTHEADAVFTLNLVYTASSSDLNFQVRSDSDSATYHRIRAQPTGALTLYEFASATLTSKANVAGVFPSTATYTMTIVVEAAVIKIYVKNVLQITYSSATPGQTNTLALTSNPVPADMTNVAAWPRTITLSGGI